MILFLAGLLPLMLQLPRGWRDSVTQASARTFPWACGCPAFPIQEKTSESFPRKRSLRGLEGRRERGLYAPSFLPHCCHRNSERSSKQLLCPQGPGSRGCSQSPRRDCRKREKDRGAWASPGSPVPGAGGTEAGGRVLVEPHGPGGLSSAALSVVDELSADVQGLAQCGSTPCDSRPPAQPAGASPPRIALLFPPQLVQVPKAEWHEDRHCGFASPRPVLPGWSRWSLPGVSLCPVVPLSGARCRQDMVTSAASWPHPHPSRPMTASPASAAGKLHELSPRRPHHHCVGKVGRRCQGTAGRYCPYPVPGLHAQGRECEPWPSLPGAP